MATTKKEQFYLFFIKKFDLNTVFDNLSYGDKKNSKKEFEGNMVTTSSIRLRTFKEKGCTCVSCGRKGTHFRLQKGIKDKAYHFGLWSDDNMQMTKDHIIPKSRGGLDHIDNMQTMCIECNGNKSNSYTSEDFINGKCKDVKRLKPEGEEIKIPNNQVGIISINGIKKKYPDILLHRGNIKNYSEKNNVNPYFIENLEDENLKKSIQYSINYYVEIIKKYEGKISINNKKFIGFPKKLRKKYIEMVKENLI